MRFIGAFWPIAFLVPLSWWSNRGCAFAGVDSLYHTVIWIHERLGWFVTALAVLAGSVVIGKLAIARLRFTRLRSVAEPAPERLRAIVERSSMELGVASPTVMYLDMAAAIAMTVIGRTVLISRGFIEPLRDDELELVVRHELAHIRRGDAARGTLWHLAFSALLVPGFEPLERRLHARRERAANLAASDGHEDAYLSLVGRLSGAATMCAEARLGLEVAARKPSERWLLWPAPVAVLLLAFALPLSHASFEHDRPYLITHHC